jgi:hypothetical protein
LGGGTLFRRPFSFVFLTIELTVMLNLLQHPCTTISRVAVASDRAWTLKQGRVIN